MFTIGKYVIAQKAELNEFITAIRHQEKRHTQHQCAKVIAENFTIPELQVRYTFIMARSFIEDGV